MQIQQDRPESRKRYFLPELMFIGSILCIIAFPGNVFAGLILDAGLQLKYEDNVVGLLSDQQRGGVGTGTGATPVMMSAAPGMGGMGGGPNQNRYTGSSSGSTKSPGDFSATLSAEAGGYGDVGTASVIFAKGFASHTSYNTYTDLDATIAGVSAGAITNFSSTISARAALFAKIKRFGDSARDSNAYGGNLGLKEKLTSSIWIREFVELEKNSADQSVFSYTGSTVGIGAGYALTKEIFAKIGYSYLVQKFDDPSVGEMDTHTAFLGAEWALSRNWAVGGEYDLQISKDNATGTNATNNIFSLAVRYGY
jgi:opacity protein-like surface antigen